VAASTTTGSPVTKVGYFHFARDWHDPIGALESALRNRGREYLENALVVLPEGFNLGRRYCDPGSVKLVPNVIQSLRRLAKDFPVVFVAALIVPDENDSTLQRNCAFLIDENNAVPLTQKMTDDNFHNYDPVEDDDGLPFSYRGLEIGCLICIDCQPPECEENARNRLGRFMRALPESGAVVCIPAHPHTLGMAGFQGRWREHFAVMASSCNEHSGSIVAIRGEVGAEEKAGEHPKNIVTVCEIG
jgi:predicted amidohydrolase